MPNIIEITDYRACEQALKEADLKQSLYDQGAIVMDRVLVTLHGEEHRTRRLLEMRVFRRNFFRQYEQEVIPGVFERVLAQYDPTEGTSDHTQGDVSMDVVEFSYRVMVYLAIAFAGIDPQTGSLEEFDDLVDMLRTFGLAATLGQSKLDPEPAKVKIRAALDEFDERFFTPSAERRRKLIAAFEAGEISEDALPMDVLTVLLRNEDQLTLVRDMVLRETAFYFLAGAHTSVHSLGHTVHHLLEWCEAQPGGAADAMTELAGDTQALQHFVHESFRLHPSSPASWRKALAPVDFLDGSHAETGDKVVVHLSVANRDTEVFGADAAEFNPQRTVPPGLDRTGLTFGIGIHSCLGKNLAAGSLPPAGKIIPEQDRQLGTVAWIARGLLRLGIQRDPNNPGKLDQTIARETWETYPVLFKSRATG